jgi:TetR/AcrR family transcriptional regulator
MPTTPKTTRKTLRKSPLTPRPKKQRLVILAKISDAPKSRIWKLNEAAILSGAERVFARAGFEGATMAQIAEEAGVPKPNLHYYFGNKLDLYRGVLNRVLHDWLDPTDVIVADAEPRAALETYVRKKMALAFVRPDASRVFANELLHGAPVVGELLRSELRDTVREKAQVIDGWIAAGKMAAVDSTHLFFTLWASTQTYADFDVQIRAVTGSDTQKPAARKRATEHVLTMVLRACGLADAGPA